MTQLNYKNKISKHKVLSQFLIFALGSIHSCPSVDTARGPQAGLAYELLLGFSLFLAYLG